jgi:hypothetical protein
VWTVVKVDGNIGCNLCAFAFESDFEEAGDRWVMDEWSK